MLPLKDWYPAAPLQWKCTRCLASRLDPTIEWPFLESRVSDDEICNLGFLAIDPLGEWLKQLPEPPINLPPTY